MLRAAIAFAILALIAAALGWGGFAGELAGIAKFFVLIFAVLFVVSFIFGRRALSGTNI